MELDDEDLCKWILLANQQSNTLESSTIHNVEKMLSRIEEGMELNLNQHRTLVALSNRFDRNLKFGTKDNYNERAKQ
jgi:hypothetical protein